MAVAVAVADQVEEVEGVAAWEEDWEVGWVEGWEEDLEGVVVVVKVAVAGRAAGWVGGLGEVMGVAGAGVWGAGLGEG